MDFLKIPENDSLLIEFYENKNIYIWLRPFIQITDYSKWYRLIHLVKNNKFPTLSEWSECEKIFLWKELVKIAGLASKWDLEKKLLEEEENNFKGKFGQFLEDNSIISQNYEEIPAICIDNIINSLEKINYNEISLGSIKIDGKIEEEIYVNLDELKSKIDDGQINLMDYNLIRTNEEKVIFLFTFDHIALIMGPNELLNQLVEIGEFEGFWPNSQTTISDWNIIR